MGIQVGNILFGLSPIGTEIMLTVNVVDTIKEKFIKHLGTIKNHCAPIGTAKMQSHGVIGNRSNMHEITIDSYKLFLLEFNRSNGQHFANAFIRKFNTNNPELLLIDDNDEAREYIFNRYLVH